MNSDSRKQTLCITSSCVEHANSQNPVIDLICHYVKGQVSVLQCYLVILKSDGLSLLIVHDEDLVKKKSVLLIKQGITIYEEQ